MTRLFSWSTCLAVALTASAAHAQTCANPAPYQGIGGPGPNIAATTCVGDTSAAGFCGGNLDAPGPAFVIQVFLDGKRTFTAFSLAGGAGYDAIFLMSPVSAGCGTNAACTATGDPGSPIHSGDVPDGEYYLIVTAATFDAPGACGIFSLSRDGALPIELQEFAID